MQNPDQKTSKHSPTRVILPIIAALVLAGWLLFTPPGVLGKADAIGYAICHRIPERTFFILGRQMPLCARCSGMQLGILVGLVYLFSMGRKGQLPPLKISLALGFFFLAFALDGINSYYNLVVGRPLLYTPGNTLRLITGTGVGLSIAAITVPIFNQTVWREWEDASPLISFQTLGILAGMSAMIILAMLSGVPAILYPLAILSAANVLGLLTIIYTVLTVIILKKENQFQSIKGLWLYLVAGFTLALIQISLMDALRYRFTGTWDGFNLLN